MLSDPGKYASYLAPYLNFDAQQLKTNNQQQNYNNALNILQTLGYVPNQSVADILGLPVGSRTDDYNLAMQKLSSKSGSKSSSSYTPTDIIDKLTQMKNATIETGKTGYGSGLMTTYAPKYTSEDLWNYLTQNLGIDENTAGGYMSQIGY
jgi:hypothetical protein